LLLDEAHAAMREPGGEAPEWLRRVAERPVTVVTEVIIDTNWVKKQSLRHPDTNWEFWGKSDPPGFRERDQSVSVDGDTEDPYGKRDNWKLRILREYGIQQARHPFRFDKRARMVANAVKFTTKEMPFLEAVNLDRFGRISDIGPAQLFEEPFFWHIAHPFERRVWSLYEEVRCSIASEKFPYGAPIGNIKATWNAASEAYANAAAVPAVAMETEERQ